MAVIEQVKADITAAMKAGDRESVATLRLVLSELQKAEKEGDSDEVAVLRRERKRRQEAATAYREAGRDELAAGEEYEAGVIEEYLPAELSDEELSAIVAEAIAETGAQGPADMGKV
ncbi:MAG: GatB/YqeY domain-containing protein, partial [Solirubrobacterales bacterium]